MYSLTSLFFPGQEGVDTTVKVATETAKLSSRTFLGHFPGPFKTIFQGIKFNFSYYSFISFFVPIKNNFNAKESPSCCLL